VASVAVKPGWTTTEFYGAIANQIVQTALAVLSLTQPGFHLTPTGQAALATLVTSLSSMASFLGWLVYTRSRTKVKVAASQSSS